MGMAINDYSSPFQATRMVLRTKIARYEEL